MLGAIGWPRRRRSPTNNRRPSITSDYCYDKNDSMPRDSAILIIFHFCHILFLSDAKYCASSQLTIYQRWLWTRGKPRVLKFPAAESHKNFRHIWYRFLNCLFLFIYRWYILTQKTIHAWTHTDTYVYTRAYTYINKYINYNTHTHTRFIYLILYRNKNF